MKVPVVARLRTPDGREFDIHSETDREEGLGNYGDGNPYDAFVFYWTEGNMGCDCNKMLEIRRQHDVNLFPDGDDTAYVCGETIELVSLLVDGVDRLG